MPSRIFRQGFPYFLHTHSLDSQERLGTMATGSGLRLQIIIAVLALLSLCALGLPRPGHLGLFCRKARYGYFNLSHPYRAPLHNCDGPNVKQDINVRSYCVFLHYGCSLDEHKRMVGRSACLDSRITHIFPETRSHGL